MTSKGYDIISKGAYSAIVYIDGSMYVADDFEGNMISEGINASTVIQAAHDYKEGRIFISEGDYLISSSIEVSALGHHIFDGEGRATKLYNTSPLTTGIFNLKPDDTFYGRQDQETKISDMMFFSDITTSDTYGIYADSRHFLTIENCIFLSTNVSNKFTSIYLKEHINNSIISKNYFTYVKNGIYAPTNDYDDIIIANNVMSYLRNYAIYVTPSFDSEKLLITGNTIEETVKDGLYLANIIDSLITNNQITECYDRHGITLVQDCEDNIVSNNICCANGWNTASGSGKAGITVGANCLRNMIIGNRCGDITHYTPPRNIQRNGIDIAIASAVDNVIAYNNLKNNTDNAYIDDGTTTTITGNIT